MTITASIERLTPLSYVHDEPNIRTEAERGAYIVGFHRARTKALQIGAQYEDEIYELCEALDDLVGMAEWAMNLANRDGAEFNPDEDLAEARQALAKATGGEG